MRCPWLASVIVVGVVAACAGDPSAAPVTTESVTTEPVTSEPPSSAGPVGTTSTTLPTPPRATSPATSAPDTTQPTLPASSTSTTEVVTDEPDPPVPIPPDDPVALLLVNTDGVWWWTTADERRLVIEGAISVAVPDRMGGVLFQRVESGQWRSVQDPADRSTASWRWVGEGSGEPIRWLRHSDAEPEIVVFAPADGTIDLIDSALVDGRPTIAYVRTRYFTVTTTDDQNPWWDSARAEFVVRSLRSGDERVLRTQSVGWEYDGRSPTLGATVAADVVSLYGDPNGRVELFALDGTPVHPDHGVLECGSCRMVGDLAPTGSWLSVAQRSHAAEGADDVIDVVALDPLTGSERMRTTVGFPELAGLVSIDTAAGRTLVEIAVSAEAVVAPELGRGDRGPWVRLLQDRLSFGDTFLALDGVFGPRTEAAVMAAQVAAGREATGFVDAATWDLVWRPDRVSTAPFLIEEDGFVRRLPGLLDGDPVAYGWTSPITLWSGPDWERPWRGLQPAEDGFGGVAFGEPADGLLAQIDAAFGPPTDQWTDVAEPPDPFPYLPGGFWAAYEFRALEWDDPTLSLVVADEESTPHVLRLVFWRTASDELRLPDGIGVGSTFADVRAAHPDVVVGGWDNCQTEYVKPRFTAGALRGALDWDWVSDVQAALNVRGAELVVDGTYGPATTAAVNAFLAAEGLGAAGLDGVGTIGPRGLDALGVTAPATATVISLEAGDDGSC